jgi:tetratricopeptide (TPR) repeat protein
MNTIFLVPIFFLTLHLSTFAQQSDVASINIDVIKVYEKVVEDGYESAQIFEKLANSNYERGHYSDAKKWFEKWFSKDKNPEAIAYLKYSKTLNVLNEPEKAKHYLSLYEKKTNK